MAKKVTKEKKENLNLNAKERYVLVKPHISEKTTDLAGENFYVFKVQNDSNKIEVRREIEKKYKVDVESVRMIRIPSKKKRVGRIEGRKKSYKKAIVKVKKDQNIDLTLV